jgi:hypothetical protein
MNHPIHYEDFIPFLFDKDRKVRFFAVRLFYKRGIHSQKVRRILTTHLPLIEAGGRENQRKGRRDKK